MNVSKTIITTIIGLLFLNEGQIQAQTHSKGVSYGGIRIGFNIADQRSYESSEKLDYIYSIAGLQFALFHERKVGNIFSFINEIHYSQQGVLFDNPYNNDKTQYDYTNWSIPFLCKWSFGSPNIRVHFLTGLYASYMYGFKITSEHLGKKGEYELSGNDWDDLKIKRFGYGVTVGTGLSYILPNSSYIVFDCRYNHDLDVTDAQYNRYSRVLGFSLGYAYPLSKKNK